MALTATNGYGNNTNTKTNYITVTGSIPTFVAAGAVAYGTGAISPALAFRNPDQRHPAAVPGHFQPDHHHSDSEWRHLDAGHQLAARHRYGRKLRLGGLDRLLVSLQRDAGRADDERLRRSPDRPHHRDSRRDNFRQSVGRHRGRRGCDSTTTATIPGATTTVANTLVVVAAARGLAELQRHRELLGLDQLQPQQHHRAHRQHAQRRCRRRDWRGDRREGDGRGLWQYDRDAATSAKKGMMSIAIKP